MKYLKLLHTNKFRLKDKTKPFINTHRNSILAVVYSGVVLSLKRLKNSETIKDRLFSPSN